MLPDSGDAHALGSERGSHPDPPLPALLPIPVSPWGHLKERVQGPQPMDLSCLPSGDRSALTHPARSSGGGMRRGWLRTRPPAWHMAAGGEGEQAARATKQGGQRPQLRVGDRDRPLQGPGLPGDPPAPHLPPQPNSMRAAPPHCKLSHLCLPGGYLQPPPKSIGGQPRGSGAQPSPSPPPPAGKQHLGFQRDSYFLNPIFQMDGGRRTGQVTCLKVMWGQWRSRISSEGGSAPRSQRDGDFKPRPQVQEGSCGTANTSPMQVGSCPGIPRQVPTPQGPRWDHAWLGGSSASTCARASQCSERRRDKTCKKISSS